MPGYLKVYGPIAILVIVGFFVAFQFVDPAPPRTLTMATGVPGGAYDHFGRQYQEILGADGIAVRLVNTAGSVENLALLSRPEGTASTPKVDIAFVQSGIGAPADAPELVALGGLFYEPLWVFARAQAAPRRLAELAGKRIAVGVTGSGARHVAMQLLAANGVAAGDAHGTATLELGGDAAADALVSGEVDAAFFVTARPSPAVRRLMTVPGVHLLSFELADAYIRRFRHLAKVILPEGVLDFAANVPPENVVLLSPVASLVAREDVHPALVDLVMQAATRIHGGAGLFEEQGQFPSDLNLDFPLSPEAERYLRSGLRFLRRVLPFWAATAVERLWVLILPVVTLMVPLLRIGPPTYRWQSRRWIARSYRELRQVEGRLRDADAASNAPERTAALEALDRLQSRIGQIKTQLSNADALYHLRLHIEFVRRRFVGEGRDVPAQAPPIAREAGE
jgi:TRAP transporter TAXI family solute receptor